MKLGYRVIKTSAATLAALYTCTLLGVGNPLGAGLLAILGVESTRQKGLRIVFERFLSSVFGLILASVLFSLMGFHIWVLSIYILIAFPLLSQAKLKDGVVTGSVIVFHIFAKSTVQYAAIINELELLGIGLGWATVFNLVYMPKGHKELASLRATVDESFSVLFRQMARHLRNPDVVWGGKELLVAEDAIEAGIKKAQRERENQLRFQDEPWLLYFLMRKQQLESAQLMMESVAFVSRKLHHAELLAGLFDQLLIDVKSVFYEGETERKLDELEKRFRTDTLPATREEFEIRASLFQLSRELRRYLAIAKREKRQKESSVHTVIE